LIPSIAGIASSVVRTGDPQFAQKPRLTLLPLSPFTS
jgi:hypothetical protein